MRFKWSWPKRKKDGPTIEDLLAHQKEHGDLFAHAEKNMYDYFCVVARWNEKAEQWQRYASGVIYGDECIDIPDAGENQIALYYAELINASSYHCQFINVVSRFPSWTGVDDSPSIISEEQKKQIEREKEAAPEARLLEDADYDRLANMHTEDFLKLPAEERAKFFSTCHWHFGQRMSLTDLTGITVGGKSIDEILALKEAEKGLNRFPVRVIGSIFSGGGKEGDFGWMIKQAEYADCLFVFNDNEEQFLAHRQDLTGAIGCKVGGGNAVIRPFQCKEPPRAAGVPTGSAGKGYGKLTAHVQQMIDDAIDSIRSLIGTGRYKRIFYSAANTAGELGTGIFKVADSVKRYIVDRIRELGSDAAG